MSTPTTPPPESRPSPWLVFAVPLAFSLVSGGVVWGSMSTQLAHQREDAQKVEARVDALEKRAGTTDVALAEMKKDLTHIREATDAIRGAVVPAQSGGLVAPAIQRTR